MLGKLNRIIDFCQNMGPRYLNYRVRHLLRSRSGYYFKKFPVERPVPVFPTLDQWRELNVPFFIESRESLTLHKHVSDDLRLRFRESKNHIHTFFNSQKLEIDPSDQWWVNPDTGYKYSKDQHWSQIQDLSAEAGDIKYVWERARFSFVCDLMRYDYHSDEDQFHGVFGEIRDFIDKNPMNMGPQYKCSQEISLRILNWTYAIHFYKNHPDFTDDLFQVIMTSIYQQLHHVWDHIDFSRIAVRNNHAITETLTLYLSGLLFPFIPETTKWSVQGKKWLEEEINYQIYDDGTFLQHSMNYHRVVVQLLTWGIGLTHINGKKLSPIVYEKAAKSLHFLETCKDPLTGMLPNYGNNDGALFFKWTDDDYRVYTSQLNDLRAVLENKVTVAGESHHWYGIKNPELVNIDTLGQFNFESGGYSVSNENNGLKTFIRCASYKDRPFQADNMHLDLWKGGINYLWDCGTYKYNTSLENLNHFQGSAGHNTITIDGKDHMLKGGRFIWYYWIKKAFSKVTCTNNQITFVTRQHAYRYANEVELQREVVKRPNVPQWKITDICKTSNAGELIQHWQINPAVEKEINFKAVDESENPLVPIREISSYSSYYGVKEESIKISFATSTSRIITTITLQ